ncbi:MAG: HAD family phosphatase [Clostridia bacterium]|nr:HAD family phosphatase [Clostridia bacterium]
MKNFEGILICTDLDGTLLRGDKTISKENLDAIEYFKSEGGIFTFVTGRMPYFVTDIYEAVNPNCPFGCINGGGIYDHKQQKYVWTAELTKEVMELVEYVDINLPQIGIQVNTFDKLYFSKENYAMELFRMVTKQPNLTCHYKDVKEPVAKIVFGDTEEENLAKLKELLLSHPKADNFDFIRSEKILFEILPKGIGKGVVIEKLSQILNIDIKKTVAVGDYHNDISMLKTAGIGIAVANSCPETKTAADIVTVSNEEHAIARIISDIEKGNISI